MSKALLTQIEYYASEIDRLTAERDDIQRKFERLGTAGEVYFKELRAERSAAKKAAAVLYDALLAYMEPAGDTPEQIRAQAKAALARADEVLNAGPPLIRIHGHG